MIEVAHVRMLRIHPVVRLFRQQRREDHRDRPQHNRQQKQRDQRATKARPDHVSMPGHHRLLNQVVRGRDAERSHE